VTAPLVSFRAARLDGPNGPLATLDGEADGRRVVLAGHFRALVALLAGDAHVARGAVEILGVPARTAVARGRVGLALAEARTPRDWTVRDHLRQSAELLGVRPREARQLAGVAIERLGLGAIAPRKVVLLDTATRRTVWLAHAVLGDPEVLLVERPFEGLGVDQAGQVGTVLDTALEGRRALLLTDALPVAGPDAALIDTADAVLFATAEGIVASGAPAAVRAPGQRYLVTPLRNASGLVERLRMRGLEVAPLGGNAGRFVVTAPDGRTEPIVAAALDAGAPLGQMIPLLLGPGPTS
jgi:ABC-type Na+ transport system ATPase subunit NatA